MLWPPCCELDTPGFGPPKTLSCTPSPLYDKETEHDKILPYMLCVKRDRVEIWHHWLIPKPLPSVVPAWLPATFSSVVLLNSHIFQGDHSVISILCHNEPVYIFLYLAPVQRLCTSSKFWNILSELLGCLCHSIAHNLGRVSWFSLPKEQSKAPSIWNSRFFQIDPWLWLAPMDTAFFST